MSANLEEGRKPGFLSGDYNAVFRRQWEPWVGGLFLGLLNVMMFAYAKPWAVAEGVGNWGAWALLSVGVPVGDQAPPWLYTTSVTNLSLILGAFIAALLSREFVLRVSSGRDMVRAVLGGVLLGIGSVLGMGCTIGGFFSAFSALSLAGPLFMVGLFAGAYVGLRILMWDLSREAPRAAKPGKEKASGGFDWSRYQPHMGVALLLLLVAVFINDGTEFTYAAITGQRNVLIFFGLALGLVNQRARFCFVRAFREPFMTGDGAMTKGVVLALIVGVIGFSIIKGTDLSDLRDIEESVNASVVFGSLLGGLIFGIGMVLTGGCASGSLWRAGEGQVKFFLVLFMFAISNALFSFMLRMTNGRDNWGEEAYFFPDLIGWPGAILVMVGIAVLWYAIAAWNEKSEKLVIS